jgi:hypothetical protein
VIGLIFRCRVMTPFASDAFPLTSDQLRGPMALHAQALGIHDVLEFDGVGITLRLVRRAFKNGKRVLVFFPAGVSRPPGEFTLGVALTPRARAGPEVPLSARRRR